MTKYFLLNFLPNQSPGIVRGLDYGLNICQVMYMSLVKYGLPKEMLFSFNGGG